MSRVAYKRNPRVACRKLEGKYLIVTTDDTILHRLNHTGTFLYDLLEKASMTAEALAQRLSGEFGVDEEGAGRDVKEFLCQMEDKGILLKA